MNILLCTDGSYDSIKSAELISKLNFPSDTQITVLGVSENIDDLENLAVSMDQINKTLGSDYQLNRKIRNGNPIDEIMSEAVASTYDLVAVGSGGGQLDLLHPRLGSTSSKLARRLHTHYLVARNIPDKFQKILMSVGSESHSDRTVQLGGKWISNVPAKVALLHVLPKGIKAKTQTDGSTNMAIDPESNPQATTILNRAIQDLQKAGVKTEITLRVRQGMIVEEVLKELIEGGYELLVLGAHYQPGKDRWQGTLLDDITDQVLNRSNCSVLII